MQHLLSKVNSWTVFEGIDVDPRRVRVDRGIASNIKASRVITFAPLCIFSIDNR
jgi:hypothetical protein